MFREWLGKVFLNTVASELRFGGMRSWEGLVEVFWKRRFLIWVLKGGYIVFFLVYLERFFLGYWVKRRVRRKFLV